MSIFETYKSKLLSGAVLDSKNKFNIESLITSQDVRDLNKILDIYNELGNLADFLSEYDHYPQSDLCADLTQNLSEVFGLPNSKDEWTEFLDNIRHKAIQIKVEEKVRIKEFSSLLKIAKEK